MGLGVGPGGEFIGTLGGGEIGGGTAEVPMEGVGEMAGVRKAAAPGDVFDRQLRLEQQPGGLFETKAVEPFLGTGVESFLEVPAQLAGGHLAEFRQRGGPVAGLRGQGFPVPDSFEAAHAGFSSRGPRSVARGIRSARAFPGGRGREAGKLGGAEVQASGVPPPRVTGREASTK